MPDSTKMAFSAMADSTRRSILQILSKDNELAVNALAEHFPDVTRAAISSHLRVLREARVIEPRREEFRWMLEEFRVSIFAQELGTAQPASAMRLRALGSF